MGNYGTGGRASYATNEKQMAAYDALPASVRAELANGYENWAPYPIRQRWEKGRYGSAADLVKLIRKWNKTQCDKDRRNLERYVNRNELMGALRRKRNSVK